MSRRIELRQHSHAPQQPKLNDLLHVLLGVNLLGRVAAELGHLGQSPTDVGKALRVGDVPVEGVELGHGHGLDGPQDRRLVHEVAGRVEEDTAVREGRAILDVDVPGDLQLAAQVVVDDQLGEGLQAVADAEVGRGAYGRLELESRFGRVLFCMPVVSVILKNGCEILAFDF